MSAVLDVRDLSVTFRQDGRDIHAVRRVSFTVDRGETVALVGESGSGKSVTALATVSLLPDSATVTGSVTYAGIQMVGAPERDLRGARQRHQLHLSGADDQPQPAPHDREATCGIARPAPGADWRRRRAGASSNCWTWSASATQKPG
jgi:ABC-type oligopeptide transport system ATPase subunit